MNRLGKLHIVVDTMKKSGKAVHSKVTARSFWLLGDDIYIGKK